MALLKGGKGNKDTTVSYFSRSELLVVNYGRILVTPSRISSHGNIRKQNTYSIVNEYRSGVLLKGKRPPEVSTASSIKRSPLHSVPKFVDLGGRRHPVVNNFPLSHVIFKVNFPLSNDPLALVSAERQQQRNNTSLSLKSTRLFSLIEFIPIPHFATSFSLFMAF